MIQAFSQFYLVYISRFTVMVAAVWSQKRLDSPTYSKALRVDNKILVLRHS